MNASYTTGVAGAHDVLPPPTILRDFGRMQARHIEETSAAKPRISVHALALLLALTAFVRLGPSLLTAGMLVGGAVMLLCVVVHAAWLVQRQRSEVTALAARAHLGDIFRDWSDR